MATGKIVLSTASGATQECDSDQPNLTSDFVSANVQSGVWILYQWKNYSDAELGIGEILILDETQGLQTIPFTPRSVRIIKSSGLGLTLYKHENYGGPEKDIVDSTPRVDLGGISSMIISEGSWKLFQQYDYHGPSVPRSPGKYPSQGEMGVANDTLKSLERQLNWTNCYGDFYIVTVNTYI